MAHPFSSKFVQLLQTWEQTEWKTFELWLQSPWCNTNKNLIRLLDRLKPHYPDFSDKGLTKEKLFRQVLPKGKYSERRINNLFSDAYLAAEKFLIFQRFAHEERLQRGLLAAEFERRALDNWFFRECSREIDLLENKPVQQWEDRIARYRLYRLLHDHPQAGARLQPGEELVAKRDEQIDLLYVLEKAAIINDMIFRNRLLQGADFEVQQQLKKWHIVSEGILHPALDLYRMRFAATQAASLHQYQQLQAAFQERFSLLNAREQKIHLLSLLNDAKRLIKSGDLDITESLPLYQMGLQTGAILYQGKLSATTFTTIVTASNTGGTFDFTDYFLNTYTNYLDPNIHDDCVHWARIHTAYYQQDLKNCLRMLQVYDFQAATFQLIGRVLTTQVYFDLYLHDATYQSLLFPFLDTFEKWLNREKIWSKTNKVAFLRFVQICRSLARYVSDVAPNPQKIENLLENETNVQALNWLLQKKTAVLQVKVNQLR